MRFYLVWLLFTITGIIAANWSPEDYEIFGLRDKVEQDIGVGTTFYNWLKLPKGPKSTLEEINKAYRKLSRQSHPDKFHSAAKSVRKNAEERFQRLSLVGNILRDHSLKKRYDYFLDKGFPEWRDTGYFYSRFRPGLLAVLVFIYILVGLFHFASIKIGRKQDFKRIIDLKQEVKRRAWNGSLFPPEDGSDRKVFNPNNGKDFLVHANGEVSLVEIENDNMVLHPVSENDIRVNVGFRDTMFYRLPVHLYNLTFGKVLGEIKPPVYEPAVIAEKEEAPKPKAKKNKGEKLELPNGKVIYSRANKKRK